MKIRWNFVELKKANEELMMQRYQQRLMEAMRENQASKLELINRTAVELGYSPAQPSSPVVAKQSQMLSGRVRGQKQNEVHHSASPLPVMRPKVDSKFELIE